MPPGKSWIFVKFPGPGKYWKWVLVLESFGNFSARSWKVVEFSDLWCGRRTQWCTCQNLRVRTSANCAYTQSVFRQFVCYFSVTVINIYWSMDAAIVWCMYMVNNCCLSLYLNITGIRHGPGKMLLRSWKVLEIFVTKRVGTLRIRSCCWSWCWNKTFASRPRPWNPILRARPRPSHRISITSPRTMETGLEYCKDLRRWFEDHATVEQWL